MDGEDQAGSVDASEVGLRCRFIEADPDAQVVDALDEASDRPAGAAVGLGDGLVIDHEAGLADFGNADQIGGRRIVEAEDARAVADIEIAGAAARIVDALLGPAAAE